MLQKILAETFSNFALRTCVMYQATTFVILILQSKKSLDYQSSKLCKTMAMGRIPQTTLFQAQALSL